jgi:hypothetical protein
MNDPGNKIYPSDGQGDDEDKDDMNASNSE